MNVGAFGRIRLRLDALVGAQIEKHLVGRFFACSQRRCQLRLRCAENAGHQGIAVVIQLRQFGRVLRGGGGFVNLHFHVDARLPTLQQLIAQAQFLFVDGSNKVVTTFLII